MGSNPGFDGILKWLHLFYDKWGRLPFQFSYANDFLELMHKPRQLASTTKNGKIQRSAVIMPGLIMGLGLTLLWCWNSRWSTRWLVRSRPMMPATSNWNRMEKGKKWVNFWTSEVSCYLTWLSNLVNWFSPSWCGCTQRLFTCLFHSMVMTQSHLMFPLVGYCSKHSCHF